MSSFCKGLKCFICVNTFSLTEEGFPEDLYDLILYYKMDQLFWVCKERSNLSSSVSQLSDWHIKIFSQLGKLNYEVCKLTNEVRTGCCSVDEHNMIQHPTIKSNVERSTFEHCIDMDDVRNVDHPYPERFGSDLRMVNRKPGLLSGVHNVRRLDDSPDESKSRQEKSLSPPISSRIIYSLHDDSGSDSDLSRKQIIPSPKRQRSPSPPGCLPHIHTIFNSIKISKEDEKNSKQIVTEVLESLLNSLKKDPDFLNLYNRPYYTGSAYNGLRITSASEFDIDLVLKMPGNITLEPEFFNETNSFGKLKVNGIINAGECKFLQSCSSEGYLLPGKVLSWLQGLVDVVLKTANIKVPNVKRIRSIESGPARTIVIETELESSPSISIDLVPVFEFDHAFLSKSSILLELQKITDNSAKYTWFMVPKPCKDEVNLTVLDVNRSWRMDFPETEKDLLYNKECAKPIIKLLKLLRDKQKWKNLASYYLKTLVMLKMLDKPSKAHWSGKHLFYRFLEILADLASHLDKHILPHIVTKQNLFHKFTPGQCKDWSRFLLKMIADVESDPKNLESYFR